MIKVESVEDFKRLKQQCHTCFEHKAGEEWLEFMEAICNWYPLPVDSSETNDIVARDARRQVLATIKTFLKCSPEELHALGT